MPSHATIMDRIATDRARGDLFMARVRLASHLGSKGYDAQKLAMLGQIAWDMHDPAAAGAYWLTSDAEGQAVESAVQALFARRGPDVKSVVGALTHFAIPPAWVRLPGPAQDRLERLGITRDTLLAAYRERTVRRQPAGMGWSDRFMAGGCLIFALAVLTLCVVGLYATIKVVRRLF